nr:MAG TPA: hypothetical protein [Caudoviricetes sp.]
MNLIELLRMNGCQVSQPGSQIRLIRYRPQSGSQVGETCEDSHWNIFPDRRKRRTPLVGAWIEVIDGWR